MLGENIKQLRKEYEISTQQLAEYMRIEEQELLDWEQGRDYPDDEQLNRLAKLFQISVSDLCAANEGTDKKQQKRKESPDKKDKKQKAKKGKTKKKTKRKIKHKTDYKTKKETVVKKRRIWPLIVLLLLILAGAAAGGGYIYWKYGDELFSQKDEYKMEDIAGTFTDENAHDATPSSLVLKSDGSFIFTQNTCQAMNDVSGTWSITDKKLKLSSTQGTYTFTIRSSNQLRYEGETIGCGPYSRDIFTRGGTTQSNPQKEEEQQTDDIAGTYSGNHSTLVISNVTDTGFSYTLTSLNPDDAQQIASIEGTAQRTGDTASFSFTDDGYGNQGNGTFTFQAAQVTFTIEKTQTNPDAAWGILTEGTLLR